MGGGPSPVPGPVTVRPIRATDAEALERFYAELGADSRASRFLGATPPPPHDRSEAFCSVDHAHREGFIAVVDDVGGVERIVGHACVEPDGPDSAEIAVAVADGWQGQGIGRRLALDAVTWGRRKGLRRLSATAFATNSRIIALLRGLGLPTRVDWRDAPTCELSLDLSRNGSPA